MFTSFVICFFYINRVNVYRTPKQKISSHATRVAFLYHVCQIDRLMAKHRS